MADRFVRTMNAFQSGSSFLLSSLSIKPLVSGMPVNVSFELTNHCNLRCPECASGSDLMKRERGFMHIELYKKVIFELSPYIYYINLYFQGEPMLHPQFFSFLDLAGITKTVVSTNGHFLSAENSEKLAVSGLNKLIVSLDGMDQEVYSEYRCNGDFGKVTDGIKNVAAARDKFNSSLKLELQFLVSKHNEHQIPDARLFAGKVGARLRLKSMQIINSQDAEKWMPSGKKYRRYEKTEGIYAIKNSMPGRCLRLWLNPVITWDGKVLPCCFDKDAEFVMGDLNKDSFGEIWNNSAYKEFRKRVLNGRKSIIICRNCTSGMRGVRY
jgi:radical SAM protein with 4Fe4S-binding SPASM domain